MIPRLGARQEMHPQFLEQTQVWRIARQAAIPGLPKNG
jgi:hypothetical protein